MIPPLHLPPFAYVLIALGGVIVYRLIPATWRTVPAIGLTIRDASNPEIPVPVRVIMMVVISGCVLWAALHVILSQGYDESAEKWAYGAVGIIIGFWLKA